MDGGWGGKLKEVMAGALTLAVGTGVKIGPVVPGAGTGVGVTVGDRKSVV